jgi:uncharacterized membrane-anchored protein YhcB (DUF1043 family)
MHFLDVLIALSAGVLLGIVVGRRTSLERARCRELESELAGARAGANRYREEVAAHFTKTSDLVQSLTLQYRTVYDHLADGARTLCPERMTELSQGDSAKALLAAGAERPAEPTEPLIAAAAPASTPDDATEDFAEDEPRSEASAPPAAH